ncbi:MAG: FGGY-family carbohydrate kinase [Pseudomonadota bacterium]
MASDALLIGVDAGTSVIKAVAFDTDLRQIGQASRRNSYATLPGGGAEQEMRRTWSDCAAVLRDLGVRIPDLARRALAVSVTGQGDGCWLIDASGEPVHDGWLWLDARAADQAAALAASPDYETIYAHTMSGALACQMRSQLLWMRTHAPALLARAATAFHCQHWLFFRLTGVRGLDPTPALYGFGDNAQRSYSDAVFEASGLADLRHLIPPIIDGVNEAHPLSAAAAAETGLPQGLPVVLGYLDVMCTALGAGLYDPQTLPGLSILGSTGIHMRFVPEASALRANPERSGYTMAFPAPAFGQLHTNMAATLNIDWLLGLGADLLSAHGLARTGADLLAGLDERVMAARPGAAMYHPYISVAGERGPFVAPQARASFTGLSQDTGWFDLVRGVFDGLAMAARDCYAALGGPPGDVRIAGGAARSPAMRRILASALNRPVRSVAQPEAGAAGAVMIAAVQQGLFADIVACRRAWVDPLLESATEPDGALVPVYDAMFAAYRDTRAALAPVWPAQAGLAATALHGRADDRTDDPANNPADDPADDPADGPADGPA